MEEKTIIVIIANNDNNEPMVGEGGLLWFNNFSKGDFQKKRGTTVSSA